MYVYFNRRHVHLLFFFLARATRCLLPERLVDLAQDRVVQDKELLPGLYDAGGHPGSQLIPHHLQE